MINRNEVIDYTRSDHFKKRARQRFGVSKSTMKAWITNIVSHGDFCHTKQENIMFLDDEEIRIVLDTSSKSLITVYSLHDCVWLAKRSSSEIVNKDVINEIISSLTETFDGLLRKQNKKINEIAKALSELQQIHNVTKRTDYYLAQEDEIEKVEMALTIELNNKQELVKIARNMFYKQ